MAIKKLNADHPGVFISDELRHRNWLQADLAYILDMDASQLNKLLAGKADINAELAVALGDAFDMPAEFFLNLQKMYSLAKAAAADPGVKTRASWLLKFPIREMMKRGWIEESEPELLDLQMMRFFDKNRIEDIPFVGSAPVVALAAKKADPYSKTTPGQYAWLYRVRKVATRMQCPPYSRAALEESLPKIRAHMLDKDDLIRIPAILRDCGVRVVFVEQLPGSKIDGVCTWLDDQRPVIGMSLRLDRPDNFCFVLRHELEHVIRGDGREETFTPIDEFDGDLGADDLPPSEKHANEQAANFCLPQAKLESFLLRKGQYISERDVLTFASTMSIHPAVVVGQIQNRTKKFGWLRKYQTSIRDVLLDWDFRDGWGHTAPTEL